MAKASAWVFHPVASTRDTPGFTYTPRKTIFLRSIFWWPYPLFHLSGLHLPRHWRLSRLRWVRPISTLPRSDSNRQNRLSPMLYYQLSYVANHHTPRVHGAFCAVLRDKRLNRLSSYPRHIAHVGGIGPPSSQVKRAPLSCSTTELNDFPG